MAIDQAESLRFAFQIRRKPSGSERLVAEGMGRHAARGPMRWAFVARAPPILDALTRISERWEPRGVQARVAPTTAERRGQRVVGCRFSRPPPHERTRVTAATGYARPKPTLADALAASRDALWREQASVRPCGPRARLKRGQARPSHHSTVTDFARLRGWSTSLPMKTAV